MEILLRPSANTKNVVKNQKAIIGYLLIISTTMSCTAKNNGDVIKSNKIPIAGTWQLIIGTVIDKGDTSVTDYTKNVSFIKIINDTHFAFLQHDLNKGKGADSVFASLIDSSYIEHLEYCSDRNWEGNNFTFTIKIKNDTLVQSGVEKVDSAGINRINIEKYIRIKK